MPQTQTVEQQIAALAEQVAALSDTVTTLQESISEILSESEYELRYSGEQVDSLLESASSVFGSKSVNQIISLINRTYPLYLKWGSWTINVKVNSDNGSQWQSGTHTISDMDKISNKAVFMICDWGRKHFKNQCFSYKVNEKSGNSIDWEYYLEHTSDQGGTYTFTIFYFVIGKNSGGGSIG